MPKYQKILFVSTGMSDETDALKQVISIARNHQAQLTALIIHPKFPSHLAEHEKKYEQSLINELHATVRKIGQDIGIDADDLVLAIEVQRRTKPAIAIIKQVLKESVDLVIKQAEQNDRDQGFKALDMDLLRQCPCPVWLCRPITKHRQDIKVAVAIDAGNEHEEGRNLSLQLLDTADNLAKDCSQTFSIISCWDYEFEEYFKRNPWINLSDEKISSLVITAENNHLADLNTLLKQADISSTKKTHHLKGQPEELIAQFIESNDIDILVMGTVARSGLAGFIIGNTAENILQKLGCSVLALKPNGFISSVKAY